MPVVETINKNYVIRYECTSIEDMSKFMFDIGNLLERGYKGELYIEDLTPYLYGYDGEIPPETYIELFGCGYFSTTNDGGIAVNHAPMVTATFDGVAPRYTFFTPVYVQATIGG